MDGDFRQFMVKALPTGGQDSPPLTSPLKVRFLNGANGNIPLLFLTNACIRHQDKPFRKVTWVSLADRGSWVKTPAWSSLYLGFGSCQWAGQSSSWVRTLKPVKTLPCQDPCQNSPHSLHCCGWSRCHRFAACFRFRLSLPPFLFLL